MPYKRAERANKKGKCTQRYLSARRAASLHCHCSCPSLWRVRRPHNLTAYNSQLHAAMSSYSTGIWGRHGRVSSYRFIRDPYGYRDKKICSTTYQESNGMSVTLYSSHFQDSDLKECKLVFILMSLQQDKKMCKHLCMAGKCNEIKALQIQISIPLQ